MTRRLAVLLTSALVASCQCGFDAGKLDVLACASDADCPPDQDCIEQLCTQRRCEVVWDCGDAAGFECIGGFCEAVSIVDAGPDAAVACDGPAECADGLNCTEDDCVDGFCAHVPREGTCAVDAACWNGGDVNPANPCQVCRPGQDARDWTADDARAPDDGIPCTIDRCSGGLPVFEPQDGLCAGGICSVCAGGCVTRPALTVSCPDRPSRAGGGPASCTVSADPPPAADAGCISCATIVGITSLVRDTFEGCPDLSNIGWLGDHRGVRCPGPSDLGPDFERGEGQIAIDDSRSSFERWVDTTGFDSVRLCFDVASNDESRMPIEVDLDASGTWTEVWSAGPPAGGRLAWQNVCLDLVALDPLAAQNPSVGVRFRPADGNLWGPEIYLDNVAIDAWVARTLARPGPLLVDDFTGCSFADWNLSGDAPVCPMTSGALIGVEAAGARNTTWTLSRVLDLSDRDDVRLGFSLAAHQADGNESFVVSLDRGAGPAVVWGLERGPSLDDVLSPLEVALSHVDPTVRFEPAVTLSLQASSGGDSESLLLDDVFVDAARCLPAEDLVSAAPPVALDPGIWSIDVTGTARATAAVSCTWEGRPDSVAHDVVLFCPNDECTPGERESQACGECGTQTRTCGVDCRWLDWSACADRPCNCCDAYGSCSPCCC